jgi:hypothetical protein
MPRVGPFLYRRTVPSMRLGAYPFPRNSRGSSLAACGGRGWPDSDQLAWKILG